MRLISSLLAAAAAIVGVAAATPGTAQPATDVYGGNVAIRGTATGWFHVEQVGERWFFITPEGHGFFSLGVTHAVDCVRLDELNLFETKYARDEQRLADFLVTSLRGWGYNSAGYGALPAMHRQLPYVAKILTEGPRSFSAGAKSRFTDIFDPAVQRQVAASIATQVASHREQRHCLGYLMKDLPVWHLAAPSAPAGSTYVDFIRGLPPEAPGRRAYADFLHARYAGRPDELTARYGAGLAEASLLSGEKLTPLLAAHPERQRDDEAFLNVIATTYYAFVTAEIRRLDPHHLLLGDSLMAPSNRTLDSVVATAARFVDVLSFQPMGTATPLRPYLDKIHALTGKPILLADVNCVRERPQPGETDTTTYEQVAGQNAHTFYLDAAASPACIGIHRCTTRDYRVHEKQFHRPGLLRADDTPYPILTALARATNEAVFALVYAPAPPTRPSPATR